MVRYGTSLAASIAEETEKLFYERTHLCLWIGVIFVPLFSLLDYVYCPEYFLLFLVYRWLLVAIILAIILSLRSGFLRRFVYHLMCFALLLGTFIISLMIIKLGGFESGYYVGILLMIAGSFSVLPYSIKDSLLTGLSMYIVYVLTIFAGVKELDIESMNAAVNNTFFFFTIIFVTVIQCYDESKTQLKAFRAKKSLQSLHTELAQFTDNLESMVKDRMQQLEETRLKYRDLFNNILDLVVVIDRGGIIHKVNHYCAHTLEFGSEEIEGKAMCSFMGVESENFFEEIIIPQLIRDETVEGVQLQMITRNGTTIEVELYGNPVDIEEEEKKYLLIIRDISTNKTMETQVLASKQLLDTSRQAAIFGLARLAECRDDDTGAHLQRIRAYTRILCEELATSKEFQNLITPSFIEDITLSSILHDIGKVGIPDNILLKPGKLTDDEFETMKNHCEYGGATLTFADQDAKSMAFLKMGQEISRYHHERWDGTGYPEGLSGKDIPLVARIVALADVYDALTTTRPYKKAFSHDKALEMIKKEREKQFDPRVVTAFLKQEEAFKEARLQLLFNR